MTASRQRDCDVTDGQMEVERSSDCGNSPKNVTALELAVALFGGDADALHGKLSATAMMEVVGFEKVVGRENIVRHLRPADRLTIQMVLTHGKAGAVSGVVTRGEKQSVQFSMFLRFATAKAEAVEIVQLYGSNPHVMPSA